MRELGIGGTVPEAASFTPRRMDKRNPARASWTWFAHLAEARLRIAMILGRSATPGCRRRWLSPRALMLHPLLGGPGGLLFREQAVHDPQCPSIPARRRALGRFLI